jgi:hypothetical protein
MDAAADYEGPAPGDSREIWDPWRKLREWRA